MNDKHIHIELCVGGKLRQRLGSVVPDLPVPERGDERRIQLSINAH
jgi:hypothetical protein